MRVAYMVAPEESFPVGTRPVDRIRKVPVLASIMLLDASAVSHAGLPLAGSSSMAYWAVEPGRSRHCMVVGFCWLTTAGAGTPVHSDQ